MEGNFNYKKEGNFNYKTHGLLIQFHGRAFFLPYKVHKGCLTKAIWRAIMFLIYSLFEENKIHVRRENWFGGANNIKRTHGSFAYKAKGDFL